MKLSDFLNAAKTIEQDAEILVPLVLKSAKGLHIFNVTDAIAQAILSILSQQGSTNAKTN